MVHGCIRARQPDYQPGAALAQLASATLRVLARRQATEWDDFEMPNRARFCTSCASVNSPTSAAGHSRRHGSADSTPLFLILLDEYERWSGDTDLVVELEPQARAALDWLEHHGDLDGDGHLEYQRRNLDSGLENQGWKDSWDSVVPRRGTCEPAASHLRAAGLLRVRRAAPYGPTGTRSGTTAPPRTS